MMYSHLSYCSVLVPISIAYMWLKDLLEKDNAVFLTSKELKNFELDYSSIQQFTRENFIEKFENRLRQLKFCNLTGIENFLQKDIIIGCQHFANSLLIKHHISNVQIFEHDYQYYQKLDPNLKFVTLETLDNKKPLLMSMPYPGHIQAGRDMEKILSYCDEHEIDVFLDCCWLPCAFDFNFNFDRKCIKSFAFSLSKPYYGGKGLVRIGIRWSREKQKNDSVTYQNNTNMIPSILYKIGCAYLDAFPLDIIVEKYKDDYLKMCKSLYLRPSGLINVAYSLDKKDCYGTKKILEKEI